ncbi:MAG: sensor domain-containing diguanylate cyclase [Gammaproteobacteria bacterium]|nr:sensor domain-containing diguanylate cyclase [Gammaproteobacteria bacterium]
MRGDVDPMTEHDLSVSRLKYRLETYMDQARSNETKLRSFQDLELKLLKSPSIAELCRVLLQDYKQTFELQTVSLLLIDGADSTAQIFRDTLESLINGRGEFERLVRQNFRIINDYALIQSLETYAKIPRLAKFDVADHGRFFSKAVARKELALGSVAILPLQAHGLLSGFLSFGSQDEQRFTPDISTDFLCRAAEVVGIAIENVANTEYLQQLTLRDPLTSANNRRYFFKRMEEELNRGQRQGHGVACLYIDIDFFKSINDHYGHAAGDRVLVHLTKVVQSAVRSCDIFARLGGEEFAVILPEITPEGMRDIAERVRSLVQKNPCELTIDSKVPITVSIGMAHLALAQIVGEPQELGDKLVNCADAALYASKENGRNRVTDYIELPSA